MILKTSMKKLFATIALLSLLVASAEGKFIGYFNGQCDDLCKQCKYECESKFKAGTFKRWFVGFKQFPSCSMFGSVRGSASLIQLTIVTALMLISGFTSAETDVRRRQQCIDKCISNQKGKFLRPAHRLMCKIYCNKRHGSEPLVENLSLHPAFNGQDALFRS
ncbi:uncharacterized protein BXIN_1243 [Babesia sp. Xinjiang]|uniref:uncharacterized protein n=1 Tax=Babesia sp. Xinjiang TaxID=462227 RepID=UPI000A261AFB|nr:uncharacterized protein BXIN_1243 [Babesia sp. Xinjiang]ORM39998.1 hypothetical protein BXIN_1243 [Babesia sp. Xinjiang]